MNIFNVQFIWIVQILTIPWIPSVLSQSWDEVPFLNSSSSDSWLGSFDGSAQTIHLNEETPEEYIAKINYKGSNTPQFIEIKPGEKELLGADIRKYDPDDGYWYVFFKNPLDYDKGQNFFQFKITIANDEGKDFSVYVYVSIENIDDNDPVVETPKCKVKELMIGKTDCVYKVSDIDGAISILNMTFNISGEDHEKFAISKDVVIDSSYKFMTIFLETVEELNYADNQIHIFQVTAFDSASNSGSSTAIVEVEDVPNMPPIWKKVITSEKFLEKTEQNFTVQAIDGDTQLNVPIEYKLVIQDGYDFIHIEKGTGFINVDPIDRDGLGIEIIQFDIIAYKKGNESWSISNPVVFIIEDQNDQWPCFDVHDFEITIPENTYMSLNIDPTVNDRDLGENAKYTVALMSIKPENSMDPFLIIPNSGYQLQIFNLTIKDTKLLDYDTEEWQNIQFSIKSLEGKNASHFDFATVTVNLENWNDEEPIFSNSSYSTQFKETEGKDFVVQTVFAKDRDIGDHVTHSLDDSVSSYLSINQKTGLITVTKDDAFDFDRQKEIFVQVKATDELQPGPIHTTYAQLMITLIDVNNKPPQITMPKKPPKVKENTKAGTYITLVNSDIIELIVGNDVDTTADLELIIDWDASYALKQGRGTDPSQYHGCFEIEIKPDSNDNHSIIGRLKVKEIKPGVTIDFEEFEVLYLSIIIVDHGTELNDKQTEGTLTIEIEDENDCPPEWVDDALTKKRSVREESESGIIIGTIFATDRDGLDFNNVTYYLEGINGTPPNLVNVDVKSGQLSVYKDKGISADLPQKNYQLHYKVTATDCNNGNHEDECSKNNCHCTRGEIHIDIIDTNNKIPVVTKYDDKFSVDEHCPSDTQVTLIEGSDADRDDIYNTIYYYIDYKNNEGLKDFFVVDNYTGRVYIMNGPQLDRDEGIESYSVRVDVMDNYWEEGDKNKNSAAPLFIQVTLLDINDNPPMLPPSGHYNWNVSEDSSKGTVLSDKVVATDKDSGDNARISYEILSILSTSPENDHKPSEDIVSFLDGESGELHTNIELKGFWGKYDIHIKAIDHGEPPLSTNETYELIVHPFNYNKPIFEYPTNGLSIQLSKESAEAMQLKLLDGTTIRSVSATDEDGWESGKVTFTVPDNDYVVIENIGENLGTLKLKKPVIDIGFLEVQIIATDHGEEPKEDNIKFKMLFVSLGQNPIFLNIKQTVKFTEGSAGMNESQCIHEACDPKHTDCTNTPINEECTAYTNDQDRMYYFITDGDMDLFDLNKETRELKLKKELNREESKTLEVKISVTNEDSSPGRPIPGSTLTLTVVVGEADPRPHFEKSLYASGITITDLLGKVLFTVKATHSENKSFQFDIDKESMHADQSLQGVKDIAFVLDSETGVLTLNFSPLDHMSGMFEFDIKATDTDGKSETTQAKIFLISDDKRISFKFQNPSEFVSNKKDYIVDTFSYYFEYECVIDTIIKDNLNGVPLENKTELKSYFTGSDFIAISAQVIEEKKNDIQRMNDISKKLLEQSLKLTDFSSKSSSDQTESLEKMLQIVLIVVSSVLGALCVILLVVFCMRTRSLNRRLQQLSTTKFGSQDSGLNRVGVTVPGTNKHAIEGSNPVWNEDIKAPDFDAISNSSGDSDLIGVEDNPQFAYGNSMFEKSKNKINGRKLTRKNLEEET